MRLFLFTNHFPYAKSEPFLVNEFSFTQEYFSNINIYTLTSSTNEPQIKIKKNIEVAPSVFVNHKSKKELLIKGIFNVASFKFHLKDFFSQKVYKNHHQLWQFFSSLLVTRAALSTNYYRHIIDEINQSQEKCVLYFYWGNNLCWLLPYISNQIKNPNIKVIIRFHRTDLYEYVNHNYSPIRNEIFNIASKLVAISEDGFKYLYTKYPDFNNKLVLSKLGVFDNDLNPYYHSENKITIVSASFVTSVKRVHLILEALFYLNIELEWYHFGDGPLLESLKIKSTKLPHNITANFMGYKKNEDLMSFYKTHKVDLFLNVSSSEGLPVSIMEAASFGIPIIATDVGGTSEIVNKDTGVLLKPDFAPEELANQIKNFISQSQEIILEVRKKARLKYELELNAKKNYTNFYKTIVLKS